MIITKQQFDALPLLLDSHEFAKAMDVSVQVVYSWFRSGVLPKRKMFGRYVILREDLARLIKYQDEATALPLLTALTVATEKHDENIGGEQDD